MAQRKGNDPAVSPVTGPLVCAYQLHIEPAPNGFVLTDHCPGTSRMTNVVGVAETPESLLKLVKTWANAKAGGAA